MTNNRVRSDSPIPISAAVLVFTGRQTIKRCLDNLMFCDEIVVVDDGSTDGTWEYLQSKSDRILSIQHQHSTFSAQREFARDHAHGDWLLTMDADEYITEDLAQAIQEAIRKPDAPDGFWLRRRNPFPNGLKGYEWTKHPRLVRRNVCRWKPTDSPHAPLDTRGLKFRTLRGGFIEHEPISSYSVALRKTINRSLIVADQLHKRGIRVGVIRLCLSSLTRFLKTYLFHGAFRFGRSGVLFSFLIAFEAFCKYALLYSAGRDDLHRLTDGGPGSYPVEGP